jgi:hypothetical protein
MPAILQGMVQSIEALLVPIRPLVDGVPEPNEVLLKRHPEVADLLLERLLPFLKPTDLCRNPRIDRSRKGLYGRPHGRRTQDQHQENSRVSIPHGTTLLPGAGASVIV